MLGFGRFRPGAIFGLPPRLGVAFLGRLLLAGGGGLVLRLALFPAGVLLGHGLVVLGLGRFAPGAVFLAPAFVRVRVLRLVVALLADMLVLIALMDRLADHGFSANRTAALGENLVLLANLTWSAWLLLGFNRGRVRFAALEAWQTRYVWVYAIWALVVIFVFPPVFGFDSDVPIYPLPL